MKDRYLALIGLVAIMWALVYSIACSGGSVPAKPPRAPKGERFKVLRVESVPKLPAEWLVVLEDTHTGARYVCVKGCGMCELPLERAGDEDEGD